MDIMFKDEREDILEQWMTMLAGRRCMDAYAIKFPATRAPVGDMGKGRCHTIQRRTGLLFNS